jgi:pSer/pThr/pTyr-binding forkhead associated (FHA) protein
MKLHLLVEGARHSVELTEEGFTVGRGEAANLRLSANAVSRVHARFLLKDGKPHVMDLRSLNGTTVGGHPITAPTPIKPSRSWTRRPRRPRPSPAGPAAATPPAGP